MAKRKYNKRPLDGRYYNYFSVCQLEGIPSVKAKNAVKEKGVEGIKNIPELAPIEHFFEVFEKYTKAGIINSYGIKRSIYDRWKQTDEVPRFSPGRPVKDGLIEVKYSIPQRLRDEFNSVVEKANSMSVVQVTKSQMVAIAIREFLDRRPNLGG